MKDSQTRKNVVSGVKTREEFGLHKKEGVFVSDELDDTKDYLVSVGVRRTEGGTLGHGGWVDFNFISIYFYI